jgi:hypothetical protein
LTSIASAGVGFGVLAGFGVSVGCGIAVGRLIIVAGAVGPLLHAITKYDRLNSRTRFHFITHLIVMIFAVSG